MNENSSQNLLEAVYEWCIKYGLFTQDVLAIFPNEQLQDDDLQLLENLYKWSISNGIPFETIQQLQKGQGLPVFQGDTFPQLDALKDWCKEYQVDFIVIADIESGSGVQSLVENDFSKYLPFVELKQKYGIEVGSLFGVYAGTGIYPASEDFKYLEDMCLQNEIKLESVVKLSQGRGIPTTEKFQELIPLCKTLEAPKVAPINLSEISVSLRENELGDFVGKPTNEK